MKTNTVWIRSSFSSPIRAISSAGISRAARHRLHVKVTQPHNGFARSLSQPIYREEMSILTTLITHCVLYTHSTRGYYYYLLWGKPSHEDRLWLAWGLAHQRLSSYCRAMATPRYSSTRAPTGSHLSSSGVLVEWHKNIEMAPDMCSKP